MSKRPVRDDADDGAPGRQRHKGDLLITSSVPPDKFYTPVPVAARRALLTRSRAELASVRFDAAVHQAIARNVPLPTPSLAPRGVRRNFFKLRSALDYYNQVSADRPLVFMYEECDSGRRAFLVTTMDEFWPEYWCVLLPLPLWRALTLSPAPCGRPSVTITR